MADVTFTINGVDVVEAMAEAGHQFIVGKIQGRDPLPVTNRSVDLPGGVGVRLLDTALPERKITVDYALASSDVTERQEAGRLLGRLMRHGLQRLEFSDDSGRFFRASVSNDEGERWPSVGRGTLEFFCPQPFLYGDEVTVSPSAGTVSINSNYYVEPVILWELDASVGAAWIEVDGTRLTIDTGISSGQQVRIDCARMETRIGGVLNVENIDGTYPRLRDGSTIETSPGGTLSLTYQERWI